MLSSFSSLSQSCLFPHISYRPQSLPHKMSTQTRIPCRAEHLGSLLRPKQLLSARSAFEENKIKAAELKPIEDAAVDEIVKLQLDCGFRAISDGEYRYLQ